MITNFVTRLLFFVLLPFMLKGTEVSNLMKLILIALFLMIIFKKNGATQDQVAIRSPYILGAWFYEPKCQK